jgi:hypothetical protein
MSNIIKAGLLPALQAFGSALGQLADGDVPAAYELTAQAEKMLEEVRGLLKTRAMLWLNVNGQKVTDKGTMEGSVSGFSVRAIPMRTGLDPKKLEQTLRAKKLDPNSQMKPTITYKVDEAKVAVLVSEGKLSPADLEACKYEPSWRLEVKKMMDNPEGGTNDE